MTGRQAGCLAFLAETGTEHSNWHEEEHMYTMVVQMLIDPSRVEVVAHHLREDIVTWAKQQPGFVNGQWLLSADRTEGMGIVIFASEDAADNAAAGPRSFPRDNKRAWDVKSVTVYEQITAA